MGNVWCKTFQITTFSPFILAGHPTDQSKPSCSTSWSNYYTPETYLAASRLWSVFFPSKSLSSFFKHRIQQFSQVRAGVWRDIYDSVLRVAGFRPERHFVFKSSIFGCGAGKDPSLVIFPVRDDPWNGTSKEIAMTAYIWVFGDKDLKRERTTYYWPFKECLTQPKWQRRPESRRMLWRWFWRLP